MGDICSECKRCGDCTYEIERKMLWNAIKKEIRNTTAGHKGIFVMACNLHCLNFERKDSSNNEK